LFYFTFLENTKNFFYAALNIFLAVMTLSGTGIAFTLLWFILALLVFRKQWLRISVVAIGALIIVLMLIQLFPDNSLLIRIVNTASGKLDTSTILRFLAPIEFVKEFFKQDLFNILFGVGDPEYFIDSNKHILSKFYLYDGSLSTKLNNSMAVLLSVLGLLGSLLVSFIHIFNYQRRKLTLVAFIFVFTLFSGHFVSVMFFFLIYFYINWENYEENCYH
jgi:hypothetical protein